MPIWCDMFCPDAEWPEDEALDGSGSCRTFVAVYCRKYERLNKKNASCFDVTEGNAETAQPQQTAPPQEPQPAPKKARSKKRLPQPYGKGDSRRRV